MLGLLFLWRDVDWMAVRLALHPGLFWPGSDTRIYHRAAEAWIAGADPWRAGLDGVLFGAPPPTLLAIAPLVVMPEDIAVWAVGLAGLAAGIFVLRRSRLPIWWLLFPPLFTTVWIGGINVLVLAALLVGATTPAIVGKLFALPVALIQGRWRGIALAGAIAIVTAPFLPWGPFLDHGSEVVQDQAKGYSAWTDPWMWLPLVIPALAVLGRRRAAWISVPALWPFSQPQYSIFALPAMTPVLAVAMSFTEPWAISAAVVLTAFGAMVRSGSLRAIVRQRVLQIPAIEQRWISRSAAVKVPR